MATIAYRYQLLRGIELVATGRLTLEERLEVDAQLELAGYWGTVRSIEPLIGGRELQLLVEISTSGHVSDH